MLRLTQFSFESAAMLAVHVRAHNSMNEISSTTTVVIVRTVAVLVVHLK
jgi:hypothetical protein